MSDKKDKARITIEVGTPDRHSAKGTVLVQKYDMIVEHEEVPIIMKNGFSVKGSNNITFYPPHTILRIRKWLWGAEYKEVGLKAESAGKP